MSFFGLSVKNESPYGFWNDRFFRHCNGSNVFWQLPLWSGSLLLQITASTSTLIRLAFSETDASGWACSKLRLHNSIGAVCVWNGGTTALITGGAVLAVVMKGFTGIVQVDTWKLFTYLCADDRHMGRISTACSSPEGRISRARRYFPMTAVKKCCIVCVGKYSWENTTISNQDESDVKFLIRWVRVNARLHE